MTKARLKQYLAAAALLTAVILGAAVLDALGDVTARAGRDADLADVFTAVAVPVEPDAITWAPDGPLERPIEPATRAAVGEAYLISLALLDGSLRVGDVDLAVHLTGPALAAAADRAGDTTAPLQVRRHHLRVVFHSADGQLIEVEDEALRLVAVDRNTVAQRTERAVAVLVQIDGVWHLRHRVVTDTTTATVPPAGATSPDHDDRTPTHEFTDQPTNQGETP